MASFWLAHFREGLLCLRQNACRITICKSQSFFWNTTVFGGGLNDVWSHWTAENMSLRGAHIWSIRWRSKWLFLRRSKDKQFGWSGIGNDRFPFTSTNIFTNRNRSSGSLQELRQGLMWSPPMKMTIRPPHRRLVRVHRMLSASSMNRRRFEDWLIGWFLILRDERTRVLLKTLIPKSDRQRSWKSESVGFEIEFIWQIEFWSLLFLLSQCVTQCPTQCVREIHIPTQIPGWRIKLVMFHSLILCTVTHKRW
jgi:hypothetical protein